MPTNQLDSKYKFRSRQLLRHIRIFDFAFSVVRYVVKKRRVNKDNGVNQHKFLAYRYKQEDYHFILSNKLSD